MSHDKDQPTEKVEYDSLKMAILKYSKTPFSKLPPELQKRVECSFAGPSWDILDEYQRIDYAQQIDFNKDPHQREKREKSYDLAVRKLEITKELDTRKAPEKFPLEEEARKRIVAGLEKELSDIEKELADLRSSLERPLPNWALKKVKRNSGYRRHLLFILQSAHDMGDPVPTAQEVINTWREDKPKGINAGEKTFEYQNSEGEWKKVDRESLKKAIGRLVDRTADKT